MAMLIIKLEYCVSAEAEQRLNTRRECFEYSHGIGPNSRHEDTLSVLRIYATYAHNKRGGCS